MSMIIFATVWALTTWKITPNPWSLRLRARPNIMLTLNSGVRRLGALRSLKTEKAIVREAEGSYCIISWSTSVAFHFPPLASKGAFRRP